MSIIICTKACVCYDGVYTKTRKNWARYYSQRKKVINIFDVSLFCPIYKIVLAVGDVHPGSSLQPVLPPSFLPPGQPSLLIPARKLIISVIHRRWEGIRAYESHSKMQMSLCYVSGLYFNNSNSVLQ